MAYGDFSLHRAAGDFGLTVNTTVGLFAAVPPQPVSRPFRDMLPTHAAFASMNNTEAARSHLVITPLLAEAWRVTGYAVAFYVGTRFDVDASAGLTGVCDYIFGRLPQLPYVGGAVVMVAEAKNEDLTAGLGQCAAEMVAAQRFNRAADAPPADTFGCVTDGVRWRFLRLRGTDLDIDMTDYLVTDPDRILGILLHTLGVPPRAEA